MSYAFDSLEPIEAILSRTPFGLFTDVDGTISPIAPTPAQAKVSPLCRHYLARLADQLALVSVISGRAATEVKNMVDIDSVVYIGNHGLERWLKDSPEPAPELQGYHEVIQDVIEQLTPLLAGEGIVIENKGITASIHYRLSPDPLSARRFILNTLENLPQTSRLQMIQDRMSIDLLPPLAANKGTAVRELIGEYALRGGICLGDDFTDMQAFKAVHAASQERDFRGIAIAVVSEEIPENLIAEADYTLNGVSDVERFLRWLSQTASQSG